MTSMLKVHQAILLALTLFYATTDSAKACSNIHSPLQKVINSLSLNLEEMIETQDNYFFSPLSISIALGMIYIGARGNTREEMTGALVYDIIGTNCLSSKISERFQELIQLLHNDENDYQFLIANGAFLQKDYQISNSFSAKLEKYFNSKVQLVNFAEEEIATMEKINEWVRNYTKGKISQLFAQPLNTDTVMALVNAVYFKGFWDIPFNPANTSNGIFYRINDSEKVVRFMTMEDTKFYNYYDKEYSFIELDYSGGNVSMILVLPTDKAQFPSYELTDESLCNLRNKFQYTPLTVVMPKFKLEFKRELSKDMIKMGMTELFSDEADLTGIRELGGLHVSLIVHKAVIEVNEKGSEASSITAIELHPRKKETESKSELFVVDHPFQFYIIHRETDIILFSGRVVDP